MTAGSAHITDDLRNAAATDRFVGIDTRLYLVTDSAQCEAAGRTVAQTVQAAVAGGVGIVQVRDKDIDDGEFYSLARQVIAAVDTATRGTDRIVPVVLNDRVEVARRLIDEGETIHIHVGQTDTTVTEVRAAVGEAPLIGLSAATSAEFAAARATGVVDLVGIGPVYDTTTKADAPDGIGPDRLGELVAEAGIPAVAIGGITADRAPDLSGRGLIGICVVSAICLADDPKAAAEDLLSAFAGRDHDGRADSAGSTAGGQA
jgi:thiamine-phosphate pyrophosphorylase